MATKKLKLVRSAKSLKNNVPFYLLYGLQHMPEAVYPDFSVSFLKKEYEWKELVKMANGVSNNRHTVLNVISMIYAGWVHFNGRDLYRGFFPREDKKLMKIALRYPINQTRLLKSMLNGVDSKDWYVETRNAFATMLPGHDLDLMLKVFAITSPNNHPVGNFSAAMEAYERLVNRHLSLLDMNCWDNIKAMLLEIETDTFEDKNTRRKVMSFLESLRGNDQAVTVDSWMLTACGLGKIYISKKTGKPYLKCRKCEYDVIEYYIRSLGSVSGFTPRQLAAMTWAGARILNGKFKDSSMTEVISSFQHKSYV